MPPVLSPVQVSFVDGTLKGSFPAGGFTMTTGKGGYSVQLVAQWADDQEGTTPFIQIQSLATSA